VGLRADTPAAAELVARLLAEHATDVDAEAEELPVHYSIALGDAPTGATDESKRLFQHETTIVRSTSARRVLLGLAAYLSEYVAGDHGDLVRTDNLAAVADGRAILLPVDVADKLDELEPRLNALGIRLVDEQFASLDPETAELVVLEPRVTLDASVLNEVESGEQERVEPGRYPLSAWFMWESEYGEEGPSHGNSVYAAFERAIVMEPNPLAPAIDAVDAIVRKVPVVRVPDGEPADLADRIQDHLTES
jgi:hypothetical protein